MVDMATDEDEQDVISIDPAISEPGEAEDEPEDIGRLRRFARRLMDRKELAEDTRELLSAVLTTSDKAKSEFIRMTGREVRHYLQGLQLKDDLLDIATNYRLEVRASFHLAPIAKALQPEDPLPEDDPSAEDEAS